MKSDIYNFTVKFDRYHSEDDEIVKTNYGDVTRDTLRKQFIAELQEAYDVSGMAGFFEVID